MIDIRDLPCRYARFVDMVECARCRHKALPAVDGADLRDAAGDLIIELFPVDEERRHSVVRAVKLHDAVLELRRIDLRGTCGERDRSHQGKAQGKELY